jgi:hypothetical protein
VNWEAIGSIGDAIGGLGVVLTLLYLAHQTRQNTRAVRTASFHQVSGSFSEISLAVMQDPSLASLITRARTDPDSLTAEEMARYGFFLLTFLRRAESMFFHSEQGALQDDSWQGIHATLETSFELPATRAWWTDNAARFNSTFRAYIESKVLR